MTTSHAGQFAHADRPARLATSELATLVFGAVFLLVGIVGFIITGFDDFFSHHTGEKLLWFEINPAHNIVHLAFGVLGLALARRRRGPLTFGLIVGFGYLAALLYGLVAIDETWDFLSINAADNWLHLVLAAAGFAVVFIATSERVDSDEAPRAG